MSSVPKAENTRIAHTSFSALTIIVLVALIAIAHALLIHTGFGSDYYISQTATEIRRFGIALSFSFSILAIAGLIRSPSNPGNWVGLRVFVAISTVVSLQYFLWPEISKNEPSVPTIFPTPDNNLLIRSGEASVVGWSRQMLYSGFILYIAPSFVGKLGSPLG